MRKYLFFISVIVIPLLTVVPSCSDDEDESQSQQEKVQDNNDSQDEKCIVTLPDGSSTEVSKGSVYTFPDLDPQYSMTIYTVDNAEYFPGSTITVTNSITIVETDYYEATIAHICSSYEVGSDCVLPAGNNADTIFAYLDDLSGKYYFENQVIKIPYNKYYLYQTFYIESSMSDFDNNNLITDNYLAMVKLIDYDGGKVSAEALKWGGDYNLILSFKDGVTSISEHAFENCMGIRSIYIPEGVKEICDYAFYNSSLYMIVIPSSVTSFGNHTFDDCPLFSKAFIHYKGTKPDFDSYFPSSVEINYIEDID